MHKIKALFILLIVTVLVSNLWFMKTASAALSTVDIEAVERETPLYTPTDSTAFCVGSPVILVGSQNAEKIFNFLIGKGLSPPQAAGFMGNLQAESGFNPRRVQSTPTPSGDSDTMVIGTSVGYGLAQWTSQGRQENLHKTAVAAGTLDSDLGVQLNYLYSELSGGYKNSTLEPLLKAADVRSATSIVMINFEAPADQSQSAQDGRAALSLGVLAKYGSGVTTSTTTSSAVAGDNGCGATNAANGTTAAGTYSLPVDKSFYEKHQEWFTKPHHDTPAADIPVPLGTPVFSMTAGKIIKAPAGEACGDGIIIDGGKNTIILYCHGSDGGSVDGAKMGDTVKPGQLIMHSASTGASTGPHLHVQIRINNVDHCPQQLFVGIIANSVPPLDTLATSGCTN